ncbi:MAG: PH domain-containing protein, partial [Acidimicrobiia bacterium]|nr:PH domain-containing protein [Acidimicrobiia bacterium]
LGTGFVADRGDWSGWLIVAAALPFAAYSVYAFRSLVEVDASGIRQRSLFGARSVAWQDITEVVHRPARPLFLVAGLAASAASAARGTEQLSIKTRDDGRLTFSRNLSRSSLVDRVKAQTLPRMLAASRDALAAGESIRFGPITVSHHAGVQIKGAKTTMISFQDLEPPLMKCGNLGLRHRDDSCAMWIPAEKVPNLHVLLALIDEVTVFPAAEASGF